VRGTLEKIEWEKKKNPKNSVVGGCRGGWEIPPTTGFRAAKLGGWGMGDGATLFAAAVQQTNTNQNKKNKNKLSTRGGGGSPPPHPRP